MSGYREHFQTFDVTGITVDGLFLVPIYVHTVSGGGTLSPCYEETVAGGLETETRPSGLQTPECCWSS